jgi:signal transduction histidine kinase
MVTDGQQIWIATNQGLTHLDKVVIKDGKVITNVSVFDKSNGLISNELETLEESEGKLSLVSPSGLMIVEEKNLRQSELPPQLILKSVKVNGIEQDLRKKGEENRPYILTFDQNNLQIGFIGISYKSFGNIRYQYRLEGFEDIWEVKKSSEINYQNLEPGEYKFVVYSLGRNGKKSDTPREVRFIIEPYYWFTAVPLTIFGLLGLGLILAGFRYFTFRRDRKVLSRMVKEKTSQLNEKMQDLEETNAKLKQSNEELENFAHVVSHDLKTPLRSIGSFVQVLDRKLGNRLDQNEQNYMSFVSSGVKKMEMVIKDLLSMSKLRKDALEKDWVDLKGLLSELEEEMLVVATNDHAKLEVAQNPPNIYFNKTNAKQLYQNLIGNGFKYNKSEIPVVQVGWEQKNGDWVFHVKDNGIGIDKDYQQKIFEMFSRLHSDQEYDGTGIGLAICKKIVEESGGQIWIDSEVDKGSTFYFTLGENVKASN